MDDSTIIYGEVIKSYHEEINFNEKKAICKRQKFYIFLLFYLVTIALLITVIIYSFLMNY